MQHILNRLPELKFQQIFVIAKFQNHKPAEYQQPKLTPVLLVDALVGYQHPPLPFDDLEYRQIVLFQLVLSVALKLVVYAH